MIIYFKNDKTWQEIYGPENYFNYTKKISKLPEISKYIIIIIIFILIIIPIIIIIYLYSLYLEQFIEDKKD